MFKWMFTKTEKLPKVKKKKPAAFTCGVCGFTCNECELAPLCYGCHSSRDAFCLNCQSKVPPKTEKS